MISPPVVNEGPLRCPACGNVVAVQRDTGSWEVRHNKRVFVIAPGGLTSVKCEDCGNHHGYRFEIGVAMFYIRFTFGGDGHDINEDFIG